MASQGFPGARVLGWPVMLLAEGNYEGPHHHDVPLRAIIDPVLKARLLGISFEGANPRHAHEWKVWQDVTLPEDKVIIPGVLDSTTISALPRY